MWFLWLHQDVIDRQHWFGNIGLAQHSSQVNFDRPAQCDHGNIVNENLKRIFADITDRFHHVKDSRYSRRKGNCHLTYDAALRRKFANDPKRQQRDEDSDKHATKTSVLSRQRRVLDPLALPLQRVHLGDQSHHRNQTELFDQSRFLFDDLTKPLALKPWQLRRSIGSMADDGQITFWQKAVQMLPHCVNIRRLY